MKRFFLIFKYCLFFIVGYFIYDLLSIPHEVRMESTAYQTENPIIIDESKTLVAQIPVGYRSYNLCFGDTLQIIKNKIKLVDYQINHNADFQLCTFKEILNKDIEISNAMIFENGRLIAFQSRMKNIKNSNLVHQIIDLNLEQENEFVHRSLKQASLLNFEYEAILVNSI